jgi:hypothetical protein
MAKEMVQVDGINVCTKCHKREFQEIRIKDAYKTLILKYDVAPASKQDRGKFYFEYKCVCGCKLVEYCDL